jgi:hypothetical protein
VDELARAPSEYPLGRVPMDGIGVAYANGEVWATEEFGG